jgi:hypothetical protein
MKRAQQQGDEWAKIYALHIKEGRELDEKAKAAAAKAAALKQVGLAGAGYTPSRGQAVHV